MKRFLFLLLAAVLLLAGCTPNDIAESSADVSGILSEAETSDISEPEESKEQIVNPRIEKLDAALGEAPDRSAGRRNILEGLKYTPSRKENNDYNDPDRIKLTDGVSVDSFNKYSWVGYEGGSPVTLDFDLGFTVNGIADFAVGTFRQTEYAIGTPTYVEISVSKDGKEFLSVARLYAPKDLLISQKLNFNFALQGVVSARYIRISFASQDRGFLFLDEIAAYVYDGTDIAESENADYYGCGAPEKIETPKYWEGETDELNAVRNLALDAKVYILQYSGIPVACCVETDNTPMEKQTLNDGKKGTAIWTSDTVTRFTRGEGREIIYDLGAVSAVSAVSGTLLSQPDWGVTVPASTAVCISENGVDWQGMAMCRLTDVKSGANFVKLNAEFSKPYAARFVKFCFAVNPHTAISELEVIGTRAVGEDIARVVPGSKEESFAGTFLTPEAADGLDNIACTPICSGTEGSFNFAIGMNTVDDYLPCVGYYEDGTVKDTFFENFLISPTAQYINVEQRRTLVGWKHYIEAEFLENYNIPALDTATKTVADALGLEDYRSGIILSIMRTFKYTDDEETKLNTFGDIDGDGTDDSFSSIENRKKAIKWLIDVQIEKFRAENYENLELRGFYWHEESIFPGDKDEFALLEYTSDYVHSLGYKLIWIPYYKATGYEQWSYNGIDYACLQPNYSFMSQPDNDRLDTAARLARVNGMCVEIECGDAKNPSDVLKYKQYLEAGVKYGYMHAVKVYYLGVLPGEIYKALSDESEYIREIYRDTYLFAKEKLDETYSAARSGECKKPDDIALECESGKTAGGVLQADAEEMIIPIVSRSPRYGYLRLNRDGSFTYFAADGYRGEDSFCVRFSYAGGMSDEATVTVTVG